MRGCRPGGSSTCTHQSHDQLDIGIYGTIKFADNSIIGIEGRDTILFKYKDDEHQALKAVYHIPCLIANIVSLGQVDKENV
jgi:hypothetical protein